MLGDKLKEIRTDNDKTQQEISEILKVKRSTYSGYENGIDSIPLNKLNEFCNYFNLSLDYICGLSNKAEPNKKIEVISKETVGKNMKTIRTNNNHTQQYIAKKLNIGRSNYSNYELGISLILTFYIIEFAKFYNVSIDWLCGKKDKQNIL